MILVYFFTWTLILYWIHRLGHKIPIIKNYHFAHHKYVLCNTITWTWPNIFLYNDNLSSTVDLWLTEVIPTIIFCYITNQWWIFIFYYIWAGFIQESIEHNKNFDIPILTSGKWHLLHHKNPKCNYSLFFPLWDIIFKTYKNVYK